MRAFVLFAVTLALVASSAADASAFGKRKRAASAAVVTYAAPSYDPCSCDCGGAPGHQYPGHQYPGHQYPGHYHPGQYHSNYYGAPHGYASPHATPTGPTLMPGALIPGTMPPK